MATIPTVLLARLQFQGGLDNPTAKQLQTNLLNDPDVGPEIYRQILNGATYEQAVANVLAGIPKASQIAVETVTSHDPNDIEGPQGFGSQGFVQPGDIFPYLIEFTNDPTATARAQTVTITEQLSVNLDWNTFRLGDIGFGSTVIQVPQGLTTYSTQLDETATLGVLVDVTAGINLKTGLVTWTFTSLDATTLDVPANPLAGFLPPDQNPPEGEGFVSYTVQLGANDTTGTIVNAKATVVFDTNAPINTPEFTNTLAASPPTSSINALPAATTSTSFTVSWSGSDGAGPGIASYDVFVSEDGGAFQPLEINTSSTSTPLTGQFGHTYNFFSVATDGLGLAQSAPASGQASITLVTSPPVTVTSAHWATIKEKVGTGKKAKTKSEDVLEIDFSGSVSGAGDLAAYQLSNVTTKKIKKKEVTTLKRIKLLSALPAASPATTSVALLLAAKQNLGQTDEMQITAAILTDSLGRALDGNDDGQPGANFVDTFTKRGLALAQPGLRMQPAKLSAAAVDAVLRRGVLHRPIGAACVREQLALAVNSTFGSSRHDLRQ